MRWSCVRPLSRLVSVETFGEPRRDCIRRAGEPETECSWDAPREDGTFLRRRLDEPEKKLKQHPRGRGQILVSAQDRHLSTKTH
jgi:hypothetical protein